MYMDERFLDVVNQKKRDEAAEAEVEVRRKAIGEGIRAGSLTMEGKEIKFMVKVLLDDRIRISLPEDFTQMSPADAELKYPSARRPGLIYTNPGGNVNLTFNHTVTQMKLADLDVFRQTMWQTVKKMQGAARLQADGSRNINGRMVGFLEFMTPALETQIYNLVYFTELEGRALLVSFNCSSAVMDPWRLVAGEMLGTLEIIMAA
ncbi:MAG TPA: hypothetical protein VEC37_12950 [Bacillota bacterium]|nr:hypothetical protein [Bacillota bacterium]